MNRRDWQYREDLRFWRYLLFYRLFLWRGGTDEERETMRRVQAFQWQCFGSLLLVALVMVLLAFPVLALSNWLYHLSGQRTQAASNAAFVLSLAIVVVLPALIGAWIWWARRRRRRRQRGLAL